MIDSLRLEDAPCFGYGSTSIGPLGTVNYFFGANGAGKTTISEALRGTGVTATTISTPRGRKLATRVYNRMYVDETIANASDLPGVFVLGADSTEANTEVDSLEGPNGRIRTAETTLRGLQIRLGNASPPTGVLGDIALAREELADHAWVARDRFPPELRPTFSGFNGSKAKLLEQVLSVAAEHVTSDVPEQALIEEAAGVFDPDAAEIALLPTIATFEPSTLDGYELLSRAIVGSSDVSLATLIESLGNSDWVAEGRGHFVHSDGRCPFCQQVAPADFASQLAAYFDDRFAVQIARLRSFIGQYESEAERIRSTLAGIGTAAPAALPKEPFELARAKLEAALGSNRTRLTEKQVRSASVVQLTDVTGLVDAVNEMISVANALIGEHNHRVRNRRAARAELLKKCWRHFVRSTLSAETAAYETTMSGLARARTSLAEKVADADRALGELRNRLAELRSQLRSNQQVVNEINSTLVSVGFTNFRLAESGSASGGYTLIRDGGRPAAPSLSEGERTFITFLYFYHQLRHVSSDATADEGLLVVIDDPISSLDSDILFVVSALTRRIIQSAQDPAHNVKQVIVLTHNTQFHKEITYRRHGEKNADTKYFMVRKKHGGHSWIESAEKNPVMSAYRALWREVQCFMVDPTQPAIGLENILRRIVENYFTTIGFAKYDDLENSFPLEERAVCRSLFAWMNDGSHTIVDDLHFVPSEVTTATYLHIFQRLFEVAGHSAHYAMMTENIAATPVPAPLLEVVPPVEGREGAGSAASGDDERDEFDLPA